MKLSKDLNLVVELPQEHPPEVEERLRAETPRDKPLPKAASVFVHSTPIPLSMYEDNALLVSEAMMRVYGSRIPFATAPRAFAPALRAVAAETAVREGLQEGMPNAYDRLLAEVHRRTMVLVPRSDRYESMLIDEAISRDVLDDTDVAEVDGLVLFFSAAWRFHGKSDRRAVVSGAAAMWSGYVTSSNSTEFAATLRTSTAPETSGPTDAQPRPGPSAIETGPGGESRALQLPV